METQLCSNTSVGEAERGGENAAERKENNAVETRRSDRNGEMLDRLSGMKWNY